MSTFNLLTRQKLGNLQCQTKATLRNKVVWQSCLILLSDMGLIMTTSSHFLQNVSLVDLWQTFTGCCSPTTRKQGYMKLNRNYLMWLKKWTSKLWLVSNDHWCNSVVNDVCYMCSCVICGVPKKKNWRRQLGSEFGRFSDKFTYWTVILDLFLYMSTVTLQNNHVL